MPVLDDCATPDKSRFHFTQRQLHQTSHVTAVWSWPVYETDKQGHQSGKIVAILNFDSMIQGPLQS